MCCCCCPCVPATSLPRGTVRSCMTSSGGVFIWGGSACALLMLPACTVGVGCDDVMTCRSVALISRGCVIGSAACVITGSIRSSATPGGPHAFVRARASGMDASLLLARMLTEVLFTLAAPACACSCAAVTAACAAARLLTCSCACFRSRLRSCYMVQTNKYV